MQVSHVAYQCCVAHCLLQGAVLVEVAYDALPMDTTPVVEKAKQVGIVNSAVLVFPYVQPAHDSNETVLQQQDWLGGILPCLAGSLVLFHNSVLISLAADACNAGCSAQEHAVSVFASSTAPFRRTLALHNWSLHFELVFITAHS